MNRKNFIISCTRACAGIILGSSLLEACAGNYYATVKTENNVVAIKKTEFVFLKDGVEKVRKYVLVRNEKLNFPIAVFKLNENTYSALLMECTHKSCELNPHGDYLICPCHGSEFNNVGKVQNPPAETDLKNFKITHDDETIYVHLS